MPKVFVEYQSECFDIDVDNRFDNSLDFADVLAAICDRLGSDITVHTHVFEVFNTLTKTYYNVTDLPIITGTRFLANLSVVRVTVKPIEQFKCTVEFFDHTSIKRVFDVVVDNCSNESVKYQKMMDKFWDLCGKNVPINYTFEIFDKDTNEYKKLNKRKPNIPNGSLIRIRPSDELKVKPAIVPVIQLPQPCVPYIYKPWSDVSTLKTANNDHKPFQKPEPKKFNDSKRRPNLSLSDWIAKELDNKGIDDKTGGDKLNEDKLNKEMKETEDCDSPQTFFESPQDRNDYYLSLTIVNCLKDHQKIAFQEPLAFFLLVAKKLKEEYKQTKMTAEKCRESFEKLFYRYLEVLKTATNLVDAQQRLKCFDLFDSIDLNLFLTPNVYHSVDYYRYKLWYGIAPEHNPIYRHRSSHPINTTIHPLTYPFVGHPLYQCCRPSGSCCMNDNVKQEKKTKKKKMTNGKTETQSNNDEEKALSAEKAIPVKNDKPKEDCNSKETTNLQKSRKTDDNVSSECEELSVQSLVSLAECLST